MEPELFRRQNLLAVREKSEQYNKKNLIRRAVLFSVFRFELLACITKKKIPTKNKKKKETSSERGPKGPKTRSRPGSDSIATTGAPWSPVSADWLAVGPFQKRLLSSSFYRSGW